MARGSKKSSTAVVKGARYAVAVARITLGLVFLWAFLDKLLGLHYSTVPAKAWIHGGAPTKGFLMGVHGPFASFFNGMAGQAWADWLFMLGLLGIGVALVFGIGLRIAAVAGSALLLLMWAASLPLTTNPFIDEHIVYITMLGVVFFTANDPAISLAKWWRKTPWGRYAWMW